MPPGAADWQALSSFLPANLRSGVYRRSVIATTFSATLEMVKAGRVELRQDAAFGPLLLRPAPPRAAEDADNAGDETVAEDGEDPED